MHELQGIASHPVQVTFGKSMRLLLNITCDSSLNRTIRGWLKYGSGSLRVYEETMSIKVNEKEYSLLMDQNGHLIKRANLQSRDNKPTSYQLMVSFEGDDPRNVTAYEYTPNGTRYPACTTIWYGLKPSSNTVTLTVEPLATQAAAASPDATVTQTPETTTVTVPPPRTLEQMEQEARTNGWLTTWHEFLRIWEYPWYRLHFNYTRNGASVDVGFNPVLPGGATAQYRGLESAFAGFTAEPGLTPEEIAQIVEEAVTEAALGILISSATAIAAANTRIPFATAIGLGVYASGLTVMIGYAWSLASTGATTKAKAFLVGLAVDLLGVTLAAFMSVSAAFITGMVATILASAFSSLFDTASLKAAVIATTAAMYVSVVVGMAALFLVPEPSSIAFKLAFPWINLLFCGVAADVMAVLRL